MSSRVFICLINIAVAIYSALGDETITICCNETEWKSYCHSLDTHWTLDSFIHHDDLELTTILELTNGSCNLTHSLSFTRVSNITIRGQGSQYTHISCHHMNAGLVFNQSSNIELRDFTIDSCGVQINHDELTTETGNASRSIVFMNTTDINIKNLVVTNSNGYGLMISDCFGSVHLKSIIFENNKVIESELEGGGGLVLTFMPFLSNTHFRYTIVNCTFENNSAQIQSHKTPAITSS